MTTQIPDGFIELPFKTGFVGVNGPLYCRVVDGDLLLGFRVEERHCNPMGICHGGMLALFADMQLPFAARMQAGLADRFMPTMSLTTDFLATAPLGCWVEGRTQVLRKTHKTLFAQMLATADGEPCLRANGIFKIGPEVKFGGAMERLLKGEAI